MTETFVCARCQRTFVVECAETEADPPSVIETFHETEPVCNECEHSFLSWGGCHPVI